MSDNKETGILVVSGDENGVSVETFRVSKDILSVAEAEEQGLSIVNPYSNDAIGVWCGGISNRFKDYIIVTTSKQITEYIELVEKKTEKDRKLAWVQITRNLNKYSDDELNHHYETSSQEWSDWGDDAVLFFAFNSVIFNKGIPAVNINAEQLSKVK